MPQHVTFWEGLKCTYQKNQKKTVSTFSFRRRRQQQLPALTTRGPCLIQDLLASMAKKRERERETFVVAGLQASSLTSFSSPLLGTSHLLLAKKKTVYEKKPMSPQGMCAFLSLSLSLSLTHELRGLCHSQLFFLVPLDKASIDSINRCVPTPPPPFEEEKKVKARSTLLIMTSDLRGWRGGSGGKPNIFTRCCKKGRRYVLVWSNSAFFFFSPITFPFFPCFPLPNYVEQTSSAEAESR